MADIAGLIIMVVWQRKKKYNNKDLVQTLKNPLHPSQVLTP